MIYLLLKQLFSLLHFVFRKFMFVKLLDNFYQLHLFFESFIELQKISSNSPKIYICTSS